MLTGSNYYFKEISKSGTLMILMMFVLNNVNLTHFISLMQIAYVHSCLLCS